MSVGTPHCYPLPAAWLNKQKCFLLGVSMARMGSLPLSTLPDTHYSLSMVAPHSPRMTHTLTFSSVWETREAGVRTPLLLQPHCPILQLIPGRWWRWAFGLWSQRDLHPNFPLHLQLCDLRQGTSLWPQFLQK